MDALKLAVNSRIDVLSRNRFVNRASTLTNYTVQQAVQWYDGTSNAISTQNTSEGVKINFTNYYRKTKTGVDNLGGIKHQLSVNLKQADRFYVRLKTDRPMNTGVYIKTSSGTTKMNKVTHYAEYRVNNLNQTSAPTVNFLDFDSVRFINTSDVKVTLREDDKPTNGKYSIAVENGTTNWFTNPIFQNGENGFDYILDWASRTIKDGGPFGKYIELVESSTSTSGSYGTTFNVTAGQTYTFSVYVNVLELNGDGAIELYFHWLDASNNLLLAQTSYTLGEERPSDFVGKGWRRYKITATAPTNATKVRAFVFSSIAGTSRIQVTGFQLEQLPFATSFTPSTRPAGRFYIPITSLGFNPATDDWVIAYWKKPLATNTNNYTGYNIFAIGNYTVGNSAGYIWWGKETNARKFRLNAIQNNGTAIGSVTNNLFSSDAAFNAWYFNNWHFEVVRKSGNTISYYVDGIKYCETTSSVGYKSNFAYGLFVGGWNDRPANNNLVSNLLISRDPSVWTDEYIQYLYNRSVNNSKSYIVAPMNSSNFRFAYGDVVAVDLSTMEFPATLKEFFAPSNITSWAQLNTNANVTSVVGTKKGYEWLADLLPPAEGTYTVRLTWNTTTNTYDAYIKTTDSEYVVYEYVAPANETVQELFITYDNFDFVVNDTITLSDIKAYINADYWTYLIDRFAVSIVPDTNNEKYYVATLTDGTKGRKIQLLLEHVTDETTKFKAFAVLQKVNGQWQLYDSDGVITSVVGSGNNVTVTFGDTITNFGFGLVTSENNGLYTINPSVQGENIYGQFILKAITIDQNGNVATINDIPDGYKVCIVGY